MNPMQTCRSVRVLALLSVAALVACGGRNAAQAGSGGSGTDVLALMQARNLTEADVTAALKTYTPTGHLDEYYTFASGGHGGNLIVIGAPSMRIRKNVGVFRRGPCPGCCDSYYS